MKARGGFFGFEYAGTWQYPLWYANGGFRLSLEFDAFACSNRDPSL